MKKYIFAKYTNQSLFEIDESIYVDWYIKYDILYAKKLNNKVEILTNSIYWDLMMIFIGYLIPLLVFQFKFNNNQIIGFTLIIIGILIVKLFHIPL